MQRHLSFFKVEPDSYVRRFESKAAVGLRFKGEFCLAGTLCEQRPVSFGNGNFQRDVSSSVYPRIALCCFRKGLMLK